MNLRTSCGVEPIGVYLRSASRIFRSMVLYVDRRFASNIYGHEQAEQFAGTADLIILTFVSYRVISEFSFLPCDLLLASIRGHRDSGTVC